MQDVFDANLSSRFGTLLQGMPAVELNSLVPQLRSPGMPAAAGFQKPVCLREERLSKFMFELLKKPHENIGDNTRQYLSCEPLEQVAQHFHLSPPHQGIAPSPGDQGPPPKLGYWCLVISFESPPRG